MNVRHFMATDQIKRGNVHAEHCPTDDMLADHMTKGLQGVKFSKFRRRIMGVDPEPWKEDIKNLDDFGLLKQQMSCAAMTQQWTQHKIVCHMSHVKELFRHCNLKIANGQECVGDLTMMTCLLSKFKETTVV